MGGRKTLVIDLPTGHMLPPVPEGGFQTEADLAELPVSNVIPKVNVFPGPTASVYVFGQQMVQRNLYRVPLR